MTTASTRLAVGLVIADDVALAGVALDVEPVAVGVGRQRLAALADHLDVVRRADLGGRDRERDPRRDRAGWGDQLLGIRRLRAAAGRDDRGEQGGEEEAAEASHGGLRRATQGCDLNACIVRGMPPGEEGREGRQAGEDKGETGRQEAGGNGRQGRPQPLAARADVAKADPSLFDPLTPGEVADALRTLTEDRRLSSMAKVGRYRVICTEPLVVKPPHWMAGHRLARVVAYDYAADRCVDACIDLDAGVVAHLELTKGQPMLSRDEEALAVSIAMVDDRVREQAHARRRAADRRCTTGGARPSDIAFSRRSAAVIFGRTDGHASLVAVVDLIDNQVTQVVPAELW